MVDDEHSGRRSDGQGYIAGEKKVTQALRAMLLRADIGDQSVCGGMEEGEADSLKDPCDKERPERKGPEVGEGGENKEKGAQQHERLFRNAQKRPADNRPENQGRDKEDPYQYADLGLTGARRGEINRQGGNKDVKHE